MCRKTVILLATFPNNLIVARFLVRCKMSSDIQVFETGHACACPYHLLLQTVLRAGKCSLQRVVFVQASQTRIMHPRDVQTSLRPPKLCVCISTKDSSTRRFRFCSVSKAESAKPCTGEQALRPKGFRLGCKVLQRGIGNTNHGPHNCEATTSQSNMDIALPA